MKNPTLRNMFQRLSEEANKKFGICRYNTLYTTEEDFGYILSPTVIFKIRPKSLAVYSISQSKIKT